MPNVYIPGENVSNRFIRRESDFVAGCIRAGIKRHEVRYLQKKHTREEIGFAAHKAFENPARRNWFMYKHFDYVRRRIHIQLSASAAAVLIFTLL